MNGIKITTIYDNIKSDARFQTDWGFGCIIDHPYARILFDTGEKPEILEANLKTASITPESIDIIILSHKHSDHQGGLFWLTQKNPNAKIYIPKTWNKKLETQLSQWTTNLHTIKDDFLLTKGLHLIVTENFSIREQTLAIETSQGTLVITGCSHTGVDHIAQKVQTTTKSNILAIFGGFHLLRSSKKEIVDITEKLKHMQIKRIAPCHCTGEEATEIIETQFGQNFIPNGAGAQFVFEE